MKIFKPLMFLVVGFTMALLASFKNEQSKKEYASIVYKDLYPIEYYEDSKKVVKEKIKGVDTQCQVNQFLCSLSNDGWIIISETSLYSNGWNVIRLERTKR